jgi:flagellar basal-body rod protein FlgG
VLDQNQQPVALGQDAEGDYPVGIFDFANTDNMQHLGSNRFAPVAKNGPVMPGTGTAIHGMLEASNSDVGTEFAKVIEAQRSFSYALKMVQTQDEIESTINGLRNG